MFLLRAFIRDHRKLAALVAALALLMKVLVPAGYMVGTQGHLLTVSICADLTGGTLVKQIAIAAAGKEQGGQADHAKADGTCPFSTLSMGAIGAADAVQLCAALAFILLLGFAPASVLLPRQPAYLRPPMRGPPAFA